VERKFIGAEGVEYALTLGQRGLLAGRVIWFYLFKLLWPQGLIFNYPHWTVDASVWWQYLFPVGILALAGLLLWIARRHRGPLAGFLFFAGTLFPVLGFFNVYPFRFSYVADHFQYVASLGIIVPIAAGITFAVGRIPAGSRPAALGTILAILGALTFRQSAIYVDDETIFRDTLARNPGSYMAHISLGLLFAKTQSRIPEAMEEWREALRIKPNATDAHYNLGVALGDMPGRLRDAIAEYEAEIRVQPRFPTSHLNLANALANYPERLPEAIAEYETVLRLTPDLPVAHYNLGIALSKSGRISEGMEEYRSAIRFEPNYADAHARLGLMLVQIPGRLTEAISELQAAVRLNPNSAQAHSNLGIALSQAPGRLPEAISEFEASYRIAPDPAVRQTLERLGASQNRGN
jgi:tetratricopeptide (TPR) repeat protein